MTPGKESVQKPSIRHKVILDTDIGTDVDDILALAFILASPELDLLGVTTAYGDTTLRAKIVHRVLELSGRSDVPIHAGRPETLSGIANPFWIGHEGRNARVDKIPDGVIQPEPAEEFIARTIAAHPGEVNLIGIAPLGNLARAILAFPQEMQVVRRILLMGGVFGFDDPELQAPRVEHNCRCDPQAAQAVMTSGLPITLVPLDVTMQTPISRHDADEIGHGGHPSAGLLHTELLTWLDWVHVAQKRDFTHMHDPLTVAALIDPEIITRSLDVGIQVEVGGELTAGQTMPNPYARERNVSVVMGIDATRFYNLFMQRLTARAARDANSPLASQT